MSIPFEILKKIFGYLPFEDRIRLREVSRQWRYEIDSRNKELVIANSLVSVKWFDDQKMIDHLNKIKVKNDIKKFESTKLLESRYFDSIRKLCIILHPDSNLKKPFIIKKLDFLNRFTQLQTLYFSCITYLCDLKNRNYRELTVLRLPMLENLFIFLASDYVRLLMDTPKLNFLDTYKLESIKFVHPQSIKKLKTQLNDENLKQIHQLEMKSLEILKFETSKDNICQMIESIRDLDHLKELHLNPFDTDLKELMDYSKTRSSLLIYVHGILLKYWHELPAFYRSGKFNGILDAFNLLVYLKHYSSVTVHLGFIEHLNYSDWEIEWQKNQSISSLSSRNRLDDFRSKLINLKGIKINSQIKNYRYFIEFISNCHLVDHLDLIYTSLDQNFYSNLPNYLPNLDNLSIVETHELIEKLNFDFLFSLNYFFVFAINYSLDLNFIKRLFIETECNQVDFVFKGQNLYIKRIGYRSPSYTEPTENELKIFINDLVNDYIKRHPPAYEDQCIVFEVVYKDC